MMNQTDQIFDPRPRRAYAIVLLLIGSTLISFSGLVIRNIDQADSWQINFYRSLAFGLIIWVVLLFRYGRNASKKLRYIGWQGILASILLAFASIAFLQAITNTTVAATTFTLCCIPFLTAIMAWSFLGEQLVNQLYFPCSLHQVEYY